MYTCLHLICLLFFPFLLGRLKEMLIIPRAYQALSQCAYDYTMVVIGLLQFQTNSRLASTIMHTL